jgi:N6-adenosine-specific RNA methylase IME4
MIDEDAKIAEALRLKAEHPDWGYLRIGKEVGLDRHKVRRAVEYAERKGTKVPAEKMVVDVVLQGLRASPHARPIDAAHVDALAKSIAEIGLIEPIVIRPLRPPPVGNQAVPVFEVIAGLHRVEASAKLGRETIPAVIHDVDDLTAELVLIDENLCRRNLSPAEESLATARRKVIYEQLHPETKPTSRGGEGRHKQTRRQSGDESVVSRFSQATAAATGIGERTVQRSVARGERIGQESLRKIIGTSLDRGEELDALGKLSPPRRNELIERAAKGEAVTAKPAVKQEKRQEREATLGAKQLASPDGQYGVILEDFEWDDQVWSRETGMGRHAANHYETSENAHTAEEIVERTKDRFTCAAPDCVVFSWTTIQHLAIALEVMKLRGFEYKSQCVWAKPHISLGRWVRAKHEILLISTRGRVPCPAPGTQWESVIFAPHPGPHSAKPDAVYEMIEAYFPTLPKIELNARRARPGWGCWGFGAPPADREGRELYAAACRGAQVGTVRPFRLRS